MMMAVAFEIRNIKKKLFRKSLFMKAKDECKWLCEGGAVRKQLPKMKCIF